MSFVATARIPTASASKYLQQVCKHWEHNLPVSFDKTHGEITFAKDARGADWPADALVTLDAEEGTLVCTINASAEGQRDARIREAEAAAVKGKPAAAPVPQPNRAIMDDDKPKTTMLTQAEWRKKYGLDD